MSIAKHHSARVLLSVWLSNPIITAISQGVNPKPRILSDIVVPGFSVFLGTLISCLPCCVATGSGLRVSYPW